MTLAILLVFAAFSLVVLEAFIPSFGLLGLLAAGCYAFALLEAFAVESATGWTFVGLGVVLLPLALLLGFRWLPKTPLGRALVLQPPETAAAQKCVQCGATGEALTDLRPSGTAAISGQRTDVVTSGEYVERGSPLRVLRVEGARIVVAAEPRE